MKRPLFLAPLLLSVVGPAHALERVAVPMDREGPGPWDAGASCAVTYANICTGWLWVWSGYELSDIVGVIFDPCCGNGRLVATQAYFWTGAPMGWGFTGTLTVSSVESGCPGTTYASRPLLPVSGAVVDTWSDIPAGPVVLSYTWPPVEGGGPNGGWQAGKLPTDHPAAGPTGPPACGFCFASTRPIHTFYYGKPDTPLCPGSPLNDGVCDAEALFWSGQFSCPVATAPTPWSALKNLYR